MALIGYRWKSPTCLSTFSNLMRLKFQTPSLSNWKEEKSPNLFTLQLLSSWAHWRLPQNTCSAEAKQAFGESLHHTLQPFRLSLFYTISFLHFQLLWLFQTLSTFLTSQAERTSTFCLRAGHPRDVIWEELVGGRLTHVNLN